MTWSLALAWTVGALPGSVQTAAAGDDPAPASKKRSHRDEPSGPRQEPACDGCKTYVVNVPLEPTEETWGRFPNTTVNLRVELPPEWFSVRCGDEFGIVARDGTTVDGQAVAGWRCKKSGRTLRFDGPRLADVDAAAVRFLFQARTPGPTPPSMPLTAGFVDVLQTYLDGEQQLRRGAKQMLATRSPAQSTLPATLWLPRRWTVADCSVPYSSVGDPVTGWNCRIDPLAGEKYRVRWTPAIKPAPQARLFYFHAYTKETEPPENPVSLGNVTKLVDLMFEDGQIPTVRLSHVRPGFRKAPSTASPTPRPAREPREGKKKKFSDEDECLPAGLFTIASPSLNRVDFPYGPPPGYPGFGWYGEYGDPCAPPRVVVDPCAGKYFSESGHGRFQSKRRPVASACLPPEERAPHPDYAPAVAPPQEYCLPRTAREPEERADRSYRRPALDPTPPVVMVPPGDADTVARFPADSEERVLVASATPSPEPTLRALLPEDEAPATAAVPYCEEELPRTGGSSTPVLKLAVGVLAIGSALVLGAVYWRRHTYRERWYSGY
ncbi:MAG: hypothetical protein ACT4QF_14575 [Sporichthyaceae bacterium]